jgi:hypothetical protein
MDDKTFRKHLRDLAHGHHHPSEHDWQSETPAKTAKARRTVKKRTKRAAH